MNEVPMYKVYSNMRSHTARRVVLGSQVYAYCRLALVPCMPTRGYEGEQIHKSIIGLLLRKHAKSQQLIT